MTQWAKDNPERWNIISKASQRRRAKWIADYKEKVGCLNPTCPWKGRYAAAILDFHHLDPKLKTATIANLAMSMTRVRAEIAKCTLLCANCHRLATSGVDLGILPLCPQLPKMPRHRCILPRHRNGRQQHRGVTYIASRQRYQVMVGTKYHGLFRTQEEAIAKAKEVYATQGIILP